jgi:YesN/AraC family two-component response regulator
LGEAGVKIVGLSTDDNAQEVFMSVGVDVFVLKPIKLAVLGAMIQEVINKKKNAMV